MKKIISVIAFGVAVELLALWLIYHERVGGGETVRLLRDERVGCALLVCGAVIGVPGIYRLIDRRQP